MTILEKIAGEMGLGPYANYLRRLIILGSDQNRYGVISEP
jgi:hypothetical protein